MVKKRTLEQVKKGRFYVTASFNNTIVTVADRNGNTLCWGSAGTAGFKGARKSTPFTATTAVANVISKARDFGLKEIEVYIKGPGPGREAVLRSLRGAGFRIDLIADVTPIPHNGVRPKKRRRV